MKGATQVVKSNGFRQISMLLAWLAVLPAMSACTQKQDAPEATKELKSVPAPAAPAVSGAHNHAESAGASLAPVNDRRLVCMVNDRFIGSPQIPVDVEGKTYYGCCPMCKKRLATDPAARTTTDPVSQKTVDKADAVIAKTPSGRVLYFESPQTLAAYPSRKAL